MGGAGWFNLIPSLPDFGGGGMNYGIFRKMRQDYASQVRHLRRREYQDMMFSMKAAGLNPILAAGATPGHAAGMMGSPGGTSGGAGVGTAIAANKQAAIAGSKAPSEISSNLASAGRMKEEALNAAVQRTNLALQPAVTSATIDQIKAATRKANEEATSQAVVRAKLESESASARAAARKMEMETPLAPGGPMGNPYGTAKKTGDQIKKDLEGTASTAAEVLRLWGDTAIKHIDAWFQEDALQERRKKTK